MFSCRLDPGTSGERGGYAAGMPGRQLRGKQVKDLRGPAAVSV